MHHQYDAPPPLSWDSMGALMGGFEPHLNQESGPSSWIFELLLAHMCIKSATYIVHVI